MDMTMELWVFLSGSGMGKTTMLKNVKSGKKASALRKALGIKKHSKVCVSHTIRRHTEHIEGVVENANYQLHDWRASDNPQIMIDATRLIALHLPTPEWKRRSPYLTTAQIRWYYGELSNWLNHRIDTKHVVPIEHWDMADHEFFEI